MSTVFVRLLFRVLVFCVIYARDGICFAGREDPVAISWDFLFLDLRDLLDVSLPRHW